MEVVGHQHEAESFPAKPADRQSQPIDQALVFGLVARQSGGPGACADGATWSCDGPFAEGDERASTRNHQT